MVIWEYIQKLINIVVDKISLLVEFVNNLAIDIKHPRIIRNSITVKKLKSKPTQSSTQA